MKWEKKYMTQVECIQETLRHIKRVQILMQEIIDKLFQHGLKHDTSKLFDPELSMFTEFTPKLKNSVYGSEEYKTFLIEMKTALKHHYETNTHHPEYWKTGVSQMSLIDILEMLADWKAASERHKDGSLSRSIEQNQERFGYSDEFKQLLINTSTYLNW
jgi:hypothetical protein